jgi:hypothetical protein
MEPKLHCIVCEHEIPVPLHCGIQMEYAQKGNFRRIEILKCKICGYEIDLPKHCGIPMIYMDEYYLPISKFTESEIKEMKKIYGE